TGAAITGSASVGKEDAWSDIDLAFGIREAAEVAATLADFSDRLYRDYGALHHLDVPRGAWIYRVFLLPSTLQVDLAFAPSAEFGARAPTFRLVFGEAADGSHIPPAAAGELIAWAWLYALHARSSIARGKPWQAEFMISGMRDQVLALACLRHGAPAVEGRGIDALPPEATAAVAAGLVRSLDAAELRRAFGVVTDALIAEVGRADADLADRLSAPVKELTA